MMTGVGFAPGWREFTLGELFDFSNGVNAEKSAYGSGVPFANVLEVITHPGLVDHLIPGRISLPPAVVRRYQVHFGDVLFNRTSETQEEVGLTSVYLGSAPIVFGGFVFRARPKTKNLDVEYSKYALRTQEVREQIIARGQGGIRANVGQRDLKSVRVVLPPLSEQRLLASILADADDEVAMLQRLILKKKAVKQGMMQALLTGNVRLPGFTESWTQVRLGDVATMVSGGTPPSEIPHYYGGGIPWVSISDMTRAGRYIRVTEKTLSTEGLAKSAARIYDNGVVLYAMYASLGECAIPVRRVASSQAILGITPTARLDRDYLYYYLNSIKSVVRKIGQQGAQSNLNAGMVRNFSFKLPPINEQAAIAESLRDVDDELDNLRTRMVKAKAIKQGMVQELLSGRTRLPMKEAAS